jgi:hypothetical protein
LMFSKISRVPSAVTTCLPTLLTSIIDGFH